MKTPQCCIDCKNVKFEVVYESDGGNMNSQRRGSCILGHDMNEKCRWADPCEICSACHVPIGGNHTYSEPIKRGNLLLCGECVTRYDQNGGYLFADTKGLIEVIHTICFAGKSLSVEHPDALRIVDALDVSKQSKLDLIEELENARIFHLTDTEQDDKADGKQTKGLWRLKLTSRQRLLMLALNKGLPVVKTNHGNMNTWTIGQHLASISNNTVRGLVGRGLVEEATITKNRTEYKITNAGMALLIKRGER